MNLNMTDDRQALWSELTEVLPGSKTPLDELILWWFRQAVLDYTAFGQFVVNWAQMWAERLGGGATLGEAVQLAAEGKPSVQAALERLADLPTGSLDEVQLDDLIPHTMGLASGE